MYLLYIVTNACCVAQEVILTLNKPNIRQQIYTSADCRFPITD